MGGKAASAARTCRMLQRDRAHVSADGMVLLGNILNVGKLQRDRAHVSADGEFDIMVEKGEYVLQRDRAHVSADGSSTRSGLTS